MSAKITDSDVRTLEGPATGNRITYDAEVKGFGVRVTSGGAKAFILNYRAGGRERRITIGSFPDWTVKAARDEAKTLKRRIDQGEDPMGSRHAERAAPTVNDLADRFEQEHLNKRRATTAGEYRSILKSYIRPQLGKTRVADVRHSDVERLHRSIAAHAPYRANRAVAIVSKMFALGIKWEMCGANPVPGIERAPEEKRERYLTPAEIARLGDVLTGHAETASANAVRLLLLTGARRGEILGATWSQFDLTIGTWVKPASSTKQAKLHRVPLSAPALLLLTEMRQQADAEAAKLAKHSLRSGAVANPFLFPGVGGKPLQDIKRFWAAATKAASIEGARVHDLRHTYASILASSGLSLPVIGALLGHTQQTTTQRYAHLMDDPLRAATERVGAVIAGAGKVGGDVVAIRRG